MLIILFPEIHWKYLSMSFFEQAIRVIYGLLSGGKGGGRGGIPPVIPPLPGYAICLPSEGSETSDTSTVVHSDGFKVNKYGCKLLSTKVEIHTCY